MKLFEILGVEIFSVGNHKGDDYTVQDLDTMVQAFGQLGFTPPLKDGHCTDTPGMPSLGWLKNLRRIGNKLVADFMDVPEIVYDAIKSRRYDRVSAEIYHNYKKQDGTIFSRAVKALSLLGADIPAVKDLRPLREIVHEDEGREFKVYDLEFQFVEWTSASMNDLPDSAFAIISSGGEKDSSGKTTPRSLRHLPHHSLEGKIDLAHLRNALARLSQTKLSSDEMSKAKSHLEAHAKSEKVGKHSEEFQFASSGVQFVIGKLKGGTSTTVQTVLFNKPEWTIERAKGWLSSHNMHAGKVDEGDKHLRFRQREPSDFIEGSFRTIEPGVAHNSSSDIYKLYEEVIKQEEVKKMDIEARMKELEDKFAKVVEAKDSEIQGLQTKLSTLSAELEKAKTESAKFSDTDAGKKVHQLQKQLEDTTVQLEQTMQKFAEAEKKKFTLEEVQRKERIERKVKDLKFPALRPYIEVFYEEATKGESDTKVVKFSADGSAPKELTVERVVDGFVSTLNRLAENKMFSELSTMPEFKRDDVPTSDDPAVEVDKRVREYCAKHNLDVIKSYSEAQKVVFAEDPKLKELYGQS